jgi:hypothetical protein
MRTIVLDCALSVTTPILSRVQIIRTPRLTPIAAPVTPVHLVKASQPAMYRPAVRNVVFVTPAKRPLLQRRRLTIAC